MDSVEYLRHLVGFESPSYLSNVPVTDWVQQSLEKVGFVTERIEYDDAKGVRKANVIGKKGDGVGGLAYFGHTDVVPADDWLDTQHGPFNPHVSDGKLYGRGSCDMKGSVACMLAAAEQFAANQLKQPIYITCTADEEVGYGGAKQVVARSELYREMADNDSRAIIGEPTKLEVVYAHKGTCGVIATARGRAAHSSTREGVNANLAMIPFLAEMKRIHDETETDPAWRNDEFDPPTISWNIGINDHTRAVNITPPQSVCTVYFRPMPGQDIEPLLARVRQAAEQHGLELKLENTSGPLYLDPQSAFVRELLELADKDKPRTVCYGTDGGVMNDLKNRVLCGPGDIAQAHTNNEWISLDQLQQGTALFAKMIRSWCL